MTDGLPTGEIVAIEAVITALYDAISFAGEGGPDFDLLDTLFAPGAQLVEVSANGIDIIDLPTFFERATTRLESRRIISFHETEVWHSVAGFGHIAHVLSTYEARDHGDDLVPIARGINSIQLVREEVEWRVVSLMWHNEDTEHPLPAAYLPEPEPEPEPDLDSEPDPDPEPA